MKKTFSRILYGGDYNPNQWEKEIWNEDMKMFRNASINSATVNVFSWAKIQPSETEYYFEELDEIIGMLSKENYDIILGTSTAALPAWMFKKYPEVARTDYYGRQHKFGGRHNACPNSLVYQKYAELLAKKLAERYGANKNVTCWHVNNEYGGECYCEKCEKAFRVWLKERYKTIEALNKAWNFEFWGHTVYEWDEIVLPNSLGDGFDDRVNTAFAGLSIDYRRFMSDSILENFKLERDAIRKFDQTTPITTNLMGTFKGLDYFKWAKEMDIVSWDNYPRYDTPWSLVAMTHDLMRGLKDAPFMLMEQTPSQQNWQPYNSLKKPGQMRAQSYQSIAHGADTVQFFQLRRSRGGCEKFHGAVVAHGGTENTRVFREVAQLGKELDRLGDELLGSKPEKKVGVIFDWENYWALEYTSGPNKDLTYVNQIHQYYRYFYERNIPVDMIPVNTDFSQYDVILAPVLYMVKQGVKESLERYVQNGGSLVTTFMSGIVDESDNVHLGGYPGPLRDLAGIWVEEVDALAPEQENIIEFSNGKTGRGTLLADIIHPETAESVAEYKSNFYSNTPVVTINKFGEGKVWYVGTQLDKKSLEVVLDEVCVSTGVQSILSSKTDLEIIERVTEEGVFTFVLNFTSAIQNLPEEFIGATDLLSESVMSGEYKLQPYDVILIKKTNF